MPTGHRPRARARGGIDEEPHHPPCRFTTVLDLDRGRIRRRERRARRAATGLGLPFACGVGASSGCLFVSGLSVWAKKRAGTRPTLREGGNANFREAFYNMAICKAQDDRPVARRGLKRTDSRAFSDGRSPAMIGCRGHVGPGHRRRADDLGRRRRREPRALPASWSARPPPRARCWSACPRTSPTWAATGPQAGDRGRAAGGRHDRSAGRADRPILTAMRAAALKAGVWLLLGGFPEKSRTGRPHQQHLACCSIRRGRSRRSTARCTCSTSTSRAGSVSANRTPSSRAADVVVAPTPWGGLGLSICYDLRFPELYRALAAQGARIIAVPSAFTLETGKDHWHVLLRARAIENQVYVMAPAQCRHARPDAPQLRPRAGRRSVGRRSSPSAATTRASPSRASTSPTRTRSAPPSPA